MSNSELKPCDSCNNTGDLTRFDGEWVGYCVCPYGGNLKQGIDGGKMKIKSHTGEMIEPRVGMIISHPIIDVSPLKITLISETPFGFWVSCIDDSSIEYDVKPSDCTLLHAPFMVGDEYHVYREGLCGFEDRWFEGQFFDSQEDADLANSGKLAMQRRHADPNLRNSPNYKGH